MLPWAAHDGTTGLTFVQRGLDASGHLVSSGLWQPVAVVFGGGVLFVLGLRLSCPPARTASSASLALLVSLLVATAVLVPLADANWQTSAFDVGFWFACAVAALGLLGSLKAALTRPRYGTQAPGGLRRVSPRRGRRARGRTGPPAPGRAARR